MFTSHTKVEEMVLKTAAFREAVGLDTSQSLSLRFAKDRAGEKTTSLCYNCHPAEKSDSCNAELNILPASTSAKASPSFTFTIPIRRLTRGDTSSPCAMPNPSFLLSSSSAFSPNNRSIPEGIQKQHNREQTAHFAVCAALRDALQRHEDALRAWADAPMQRVPCNQPSFLPRPGPSSACSKKAATESTSAALPPSRIRSPAYIDGLNDTDVYVKSQDKCAQRVSTACTTFLNPAVAPVVQRHCRVLAKGSMAGIGLPQFSSVKLATQDSHNNQLAQGNGTAAEAPQRTGSANVNGEKTGTSAVALQGANVQETTPYPSHETSSMEDGYVASQSSLSDTSKEMHRGAGTHQTGNPTTGGAATHGTPLVPYQLPLHMHWDAAATHTLTTLSSALPKKGLAGKTGDNGEEGDDGEEDERRIFLREQAARYTQWRNRQAAILQSLAPDMWDRALPPYAALDRTPHVMDGDLRRCASTVGHFQHDSGVVYI